MGATQSLKKAIDEKNFKKSVESVQEGADLFSKETKCPNFADYARSQGTTPQICCYLSIEVALKSLELNRPLPGGGSLDDVQDEGGHTFLSFAVKNNLPHLVRKLLERGASIDATDRVGATPLLIAVEMNLSELATQLIHAKANVNVMNSFNHVPLYFAAMNANVALSKLLLSGGANPNIASNTGITSLTRSATSDDLEMVQLLLQNKAQIDMGCARGETALYAASGKGHVKTVEVLLKAKADPNLSNRDGYTPLINACRNSHIDAVKSLLHHRADPNIGAADMTTPLIHSANASQILLEMLLTAGADINHQSLSGLTVVTRALEQSNMPNTQYLLDQNANITIGTVRGSDFLGYAALKSLTIASVVQNQVRSSANNTNTLYIRDASREPIQPGIPKSAVHAEVFKNDMIGNNKDITGPTMKFNKALTGNETIRGSFHRGGLRADLFSSGGSGQMDKDAAADGTDDGLQTSSSQLSQQQHQIVLQSSSFSQHHQSQLMESGSGNPFLVGSTSNLEGIGSGNITMGGSYQQQQQQSIDSLPHSLSSINLDATTPNAQLGTQYGIGTPNLTPMKVPGSPGGLALRQTGQSFSMFQNNNNNNNNNPPQPGTPTSLKAQLQSVTANSGSGSPALGSQSNLFAPQSNTSRSGINVQYQIPATQKNNTLSRSVRTPGANKQTDSPFQHSVNYHTLNQPKPMQVYSTPTQPSFFVNVDENNPQSLSLARTNSNLGNPGFNRQMSSLDLQNGTNSGRFNPVSLQKSTSHVPIYNPDTKQQENVPMYLPIYNPDTKQVEGGPIKMAEIGNNNNNNNNGQNNNNNNNNTGQNNNNNNNQNNNTNIKFTSSSSSLPPQPPSFLSTPPPPQDVLGLAPPQRSSQDNAFELPPPPPTSTPTPTPPQIITPPPTPPQITTPPMTPTHLTSGNIKTIDDNNNNNMNKIDDAMIDNDINTIMDTIVNTRSPFGSSSSSSPPMYLPSPPMSAPGEETSTVSTIVGDNNQSLSSSDQQYALPPQPPQPPQPPNESEIEYSMPIAVPLVPETPLEVGNNEQNGQNDNQNQQNGQNDNQNQQNGQNDHQNAQNGDELGELVEEEPLDDSNPAEMLYKNWRVAENDGETYFYNAITKTTRWNKPAILEHISNMCAKNCGCALFNWNNTSPRIARCQCGHDH